MHVNFYTPVSLIILHIACTFRNELKQAVRLKTEFEGGGGVVLWCLTPFSTIFQLYRGGRFNWCMKPKYLGETIDLPQVN